MLTEACHPRSPLARLSWAQGEGTLVSLLGASQVWHNEFIVKKQALLITVVLSIQLSPMPLPWTTTFSSFGLKVQLLLDLVRLHLTLIQAVLTQVIGLGASNFSISYLFCVFL